jgi:glutaminase A
MAAVLANGGIHPHSGQRVIAGHYVKDVLSVMFSSGLYEYSGQWAYRVGLPAKSGLSGAIMAVVPGRMGLAVYSPLLGSRHKSIRGVRVLEEIANRCHFHVLSRPAPGAFSGKPGSIFGEQDRFTGLLREIHQKYRDLDAGEIYSSGSGLDSGDKDHFGISAVLTDGTICEAGDSRADFLIQSVSKLFAYGLALEDHGREGVLKRVDVEPTGDAYNSIIKVEPYTKRSHNPMVNTGGIAVTSLIKGEGPARKLNRILAMYSRYVGRRVYIDAPAFIAEQAASDRNRAISYLLRNFGMIEGDIQQTLDLYLQQCSAIINCRDLAVMGATLAHDGRNPVTGERALQADYVRDLLTVMYTCGMYDFAGEWAYEVGLPAKSGVSGCILGVVPGRMGIAVYSPPLDRRGNSLRGIKVFEELSKRLGLHLFHQPREQTRHEG